MNDKRKLLEQLGWPTDLIDAFLDSDLATAIAPRFSGDTGPAYVDRPNILVQADPAAISNGTALAIKA